MYACVGSSPSVFTSDEEVCVCLSVCVQNISKIYERILMKAWPRKQLVRDFGVDLDSSLDPGSSKAGSFSRILYH